MKDLWSKVLFKYYNGWTDKLVSFAPLCTFILLVFLLLFLIIMKLFYSSHFRNASDFIFFLGIKFKCHFYEERRMYWQSITINSKNWCHNWSIYILDYLHLLKWQTGSCEGRLNLTYSLYRWRFGQHATRCFNPVVVVFPVLSQFDVCSLVLAL